MASVSAPPTTRSKILQRAQSVIHPMATTRSTSTTSEPEHEGGLPKVLHDFLENSRKGLTSHYHEPSSLAAILDAIKDLNSLDDRKMLLEHVLTFMSRLPPGKLQSKIENGVIELLYDDLSHPPPTYLGDKYAFRTADGSYNNITDPDMGKANSPYARSVQQTHPLPQNMLPDSGLVFDTLLKREKFVEHPAGLSSMMFAFAALVIHTVFRTSHQNVSINETSSYIDLAPLYGSDQDTQDKLRVRDGRGLLHPDTFAEDRLLLLPPAVCVLLVCFNLNHNYIANKLLEINERGTYSDPDAIPASDPQRTQKLATQDEEIFQTARLINCAWFGAAVFSDYFGSILGLVRQGSSWSLSPFGEIRDADHKLFERGRGNVCSVEFNCLYRWHATTSEADEKWVEQLMSRIFPDKPADQLTVQDFKDATARIKAQEPDMEHWTFGNLTRNTSDGKFNDKDLASIIKTASEHPASAFKARGTPHVMKLHEIMGIESNRRWGVCSLNEFRKFLGLKAYSSFLEWNSDPEIADAAEKLYGDIENLELYVGLQAEEAKHVVDGAGLCPGYTISRAILSDAIALTRGDRFFTADYTPYNMTAWGFADCQRDANGPGNGSMLGRLLLRALPGEFTANSVYAWFPLQTPTAMKGFLKKLNQDQLYSFDRPQDPIETIIAKEYRDVEQILKNPQFKSPYHIKAGRIIHGEGFFLAPADVERGDRDQREVLRALTSEPGATDKIAQKFYEITQKLMNSKSYSLSDKQTRNVDIARDVLRYVPLHWAASLAGIQLKTSKTARGDYTEPELYEMLTDIYTFLFLDVDASKALRLEESVKDHVAKLKEHIKYGAGSAASRLSIFNIVGTIFGTTKKKGKHPFVAKLAEAGANEDDVANNILALLVGASVELSQSLINLVNFYLDKADVASRFQTAEVKDTSLDAYIYEALRIDPPFRGVYREAITDQTVGSISVKKGQVVFVDLAAASQDADVFPNPTSVDLNRQPKERYLTGDGVTRSLGDELTVKIMSQVLRAVFEFSNLRRGPGRTGELKRYKVVAENTLRYEYLGKDYLPTAWPNTMLVQYDVPPPAAQPAVQNGA